MKSWDWAREREGIPTYQKAIVYCSMTVQDLEHDQQAWDKESKLYNPDQSYE